jgi:tetratricopeptide (TPR) repeat protein
MATSTGTGRWVRRAATSLAVLCAIGLGARTARADDASVFDAGQAAYDAGQYAQAEILFRKMLDPKNPPCAAAAVGDACRINKDYDERVRSLMAASLVVLKRSEEADALFEQNLLARPAWEPNQAVYPLSAWQRFLEVKKRLKPKLDEILLHQQSADQKLVEARQKAKEEYDAWIQRLERMASQRQVVGSNSRLIAAVPFGIGQYQNRDRNLALVFAISEGLAGGIAIATGVLTNYYTSINPNLPSCRDPMGNLVPCDANARAALQANANTALTVNRISFVSFIGLAVLGIAQAEIGFNPAPVTTSPTPRTIPPAPKVDIKVEPIVSFVPQGGFVGLRGSF